MRGWSSSIGVRVTRAAGAIQPPLAAAQPLGAVDGGANTAAGGPPSISAGWGQDRFAFHTHPVAGVTTAVSPQAQLRPG